MVSYQSLIKKLEYDQSLLGEMWKEVFWEASPKFLQKKEESEREELLPSFPSCFHIDIAQVI